MGGVQSQASASLLLCLPVSWEEEGRDSLLGRVFFLPDVEQPKEEMCTCLEEQE